MSNASRLFAVVVLAGALVVTAAVIAGEGQGHDHAEGEAHGHDQNAAAAEMEAWMKVAGPNDHHAHLAKMVGKWKAKGKMWMAPGAPAQELEGTSVNEMILGGRFLRTSYDSEFMGMPFHGIGLDGYDNIAKKHIGMWMDTMGTQVMQFAGACKQNGRVNSMMAEFMDPTGTLRKSRSVTTIISDDQFKYEMFNVLPDGEETKGMELVYTRQ